MENSWTMIKQHFVKESTIATMGYQIQLNKAIGLFMKLQDNLQDKEQSIEVFNDDEEVGESLLSSFAIKQLKDAGVL